MTARFDFLLPALGALGFFVFGVLYVVWPASYFSLLPFWMETPGPHPFVDYEAVAEAVVCWAKGIDVYVTNPCDFMDRVHAYSPVWLRLTFLPAGAGWNDAMGLCIGFGFLVSLGFVPRPIRGWGRTLTLSTAFSGVTVYALERANVDLLMFALVVCAGLALARGPLYRIAGYAAILLCAILKFYPAVLIALVWRERLKAALLAGSLASMALVGFYLTYPVEIGRAMENIPQMSIFFDEWGARILPMGLALHFAGEDQIRLRTSILVFSAAFLLWWALVMGFAIREAVPRAMAVLPERARMFLLIGSLLVCGCFFAGASVSYRGIFLLFVLPACLFMGRSSVLFRCTSGAILAVMWAHPVRWIVAAVAGGAAYPEDGSPSAFAVWFVNELAWWWIVPVLLTVTVRFLLDSPATQALFGRAIVAPEGAA